MLSHIHTHNMNHITSQRPPQSLRLSSLPPPATSFDPLGLTVEKVACLLMALETEQCQQEMAYIALGMHAE